MNQSISARMTNSRASVKMYAKPKDHVDDYKTLDIGAGKTFRSLNEACHFLNYNLQDKSMREADHFDLFDHIEELYEGACYEDSDVIVCDAPYIENVHSNGPNGSQDVTQYDQVSSIIQEPKEEEMKVTVI
jgi:hypothetical protein